jgi:hypothetical protein
MSRFDEFLHQTGERLALPKATRSLILVEIASDLEDLFQFYLQQGMTEEQAAARAEEKVDMSDAALAELVRVHSDVRSWTERIGLGAQAFLECIAMTLLVLFFVAAAATSADGRVLAHLTRYIWPILGILLLLVVTFTVQVTGFSGRPHPRRLRERLATPLFLGAGSVVVGFLSAGVQLYRALMRMAGRPEEAGAVFAQAVLGSTATVACALLVALIAGFLWFVLAGRVARLEDEAAEAFTEVGR